MRAFIESIEVEVAGLFRTVLTAGWTQRLPYEDDVARLYYVGSGAGARIRIAGRTVRLKPHHVYLIPPHTRHEQYCDGRVDLHWTLFSATLPGNVDLFLVLPVSVEVQPANRRMVATLLARLREIWDGENPGDAIEARGILMQLIAPFLNATAPDHLRRRHDELQRLRPAVDLIEARASDPPSVAEMADAVHLSASYFAARFRACFGTTPQKYMMRRRLQRARARLIGSGETLDAIGREFGFSDGFHFSRAFRNWTGVAPGAYRKDVRGGTNPPGHE